MKWQSVIYIFLFVLVFWGVEHSRRHLWEPDEARYAYVAKEMMQDGHWAVPHRHGSFYAHKPPLYFWLIRLAVTITGRGVDGVTARLPSLLASFVSLIVTGLFAVKLFGRRALLPSVLVLSTCFLVWHEGGMGRMDSVLLALELCSVYFMLKADEKKCDAWRAIGYVFMGLGVLAKGPVGLIVPLLVYLALRKAKGERLLAWHLAWGLPVALLFPLLWFGAAWAEGAPKEYFQELIFKQNFGRLSGKVSFGKPRPFYFYLIHVPAEFLPWTVMLPAAIAALWKAGKKQELRMLAGWALAVILFFTLSSGKRNLYVLMAYPAMALIIAGACAEFRVLSRKWSLLTVAAAASFQFLLGLTGILTGLYLGYCPHASETAPQMPVAPSLFYAPSALLLAGAAAVVLVYRRWGLGHRLVLTYAAGFAACWFAVSNLIFPALNEHKTPVEIISAVRPYAEAGDTMIIYGTTSEIVPLYCGMRSTNAVDPEQLKARMRDEEAGVIVLRKEAWLKVKHVIRGGKVLGECTVGHKTMVLYGFGRR